jgi:hypothetical protein
MILRSELKNKANFDQLESWEIQPLGEFHLDRNRASSRELQEKVKTDPILTMIFYAHAYIGIRTMLGPSF